MTERHLRQLANAVLWPGFASHHLPDWLGRALKDGLAGVVYFPGNISDAEQLAGLSEQIHTANPDAVIGVDEEGGLVTRLEAQRGSSVPGNAALGSLDDEAITRDVYRHLGAMVRRAGIDIDLAPVVDVNSNPANPVIGVRSFGSNALQVSRHGAAAVEGLQSAGVAACAKHFPGHGDTVTDSHVEPTRSEVDRETFERVHLRPFRDMIAAGARCIMTAHIVVPSLGDAPATINPAAIRLLRELGFRGLVITDALEMGAISRTVGMGRGAVLALKAGCELLCIGSPAKGRGPDGRRFDEADYLEAREAVVSALVSGELSPKVLERAIQRRLEVRRWARSWHDESDETPVDGLAIADRAMRLRGPVRLGDGVVRVIDARAGNRAAGASPDPFTLALREHRDVDRVPVTERDPQRAAAEATRALAGADEAVLLVSQPQTSPREQAVLDAVLAARPTAILVRVGWPTGAGAPGAEREVWTLGTSGVSAQALARSLAG